MNILPMTKSKMLQGTIIVLCVTMLCVFIIAILVGGVPRILFAIFIILPNTVGLWLMKEPARLIVSTFIMFLVIVVPLGLINPFAAMDAQDQNSPDVWSLVLEIYPWVAVGLFVVHILGIHKHEFKSVFQHSNS